MVGRALALRGFLTPPEAGQTAGSGQVFALHIGVVGAPVGVPLCAVGCGGRGPAIHDVGPAGAATGWRDGVAAIGVDATDLRPHNTRSRPVPVYIVAVPFLS